MPGEKELALRGHDGSREAVNKGNILQLLDLITKDSVRANVVQQHVAQKKANNTNRLYGIKNKKNVGNCN